MKFKPPYQIPSEVEKLLLGVHIDFKVSPRSEPTMPGRHFVDIMVRHENDEVKIGLVLFQNGDWDFVSMIYKNCIYQDEPRVLMLGALAQLLKNNLKKSKTFLSKKDRWLILDEAGKILLAPYDVL
jgi:hypothetical protein